MIVNNLRDFLECALLYNIPFHFLISQKVYIIIYIREGSIIFRIKECPLIPLNDPFRTKGASSEKNSLRAYDKPDVLGQSDDYDISIYHSQSQRLPSEQWSPSNILTR